MRLLRIALPMMLIALTTAAHSADVPDAQQIRALLSSTFDKPDARVVAEPVVVTGTHAIASWTQGDMGGRALLRKDKGKWILVACAGDGLKEAGTLETAGIPRDAAGKLIRQLAAAEAMVPEERRKRFSLFGPMVDAGTAHAASPAQKH